MSREVRFNYAGARVLVTGGSNGIGLAIAEAYARSGAVVSITGTASQKSDYPHDLSGFEYHSLDMRNGTAVDEVVSCVGELDVLVNCAGKSSRVREHTPDGFEESIRVNLLGTQRACLAGFAGLAARKGSVINIASMSSYFGFPHVPGYGASKTAIISLTKSLAMLWATDGIRVNAIAPGWVATKLTAPARADPLRNAAILNRTPLGRWAIPREMSGAVLFLSSDLAGFITGVTLPVDGGYSIT
jgi:NAD(P)-dependent dehydrogenase (short-subunit alcohol dehydrogenase family)